MNHAACINLEHQIGIQCAIAWPYTDHKPLSFQKSIGTTLSFDNRTRAELPTFPLSLLGRDAELSEFFENHLVDLREQVDDPWCLNVDYDLTFVVERSMLPERIYGSTIGPFTIDDLTNLRTLVVQIVDYAWSTWQVFYIENYQVKKRTGGLTGTDLHEMYRQYWYKKDGSESSLNEIGTHLLIEYRKLARQRIRQGDLESAAQYSQVCLNLSMNFENIEREILNEFEQFAGKWNQLTAQKENTVKKRATVAREGAAEFWRVQMAALGREKRIQAISADFQEVLQNLDPEEERREILKKSKSNPYRRGFELAESVSAGFGSVGTAMWGILTEWPLEALRLRVPACAVEQLQKDSILSPDFRALRLAKIASEHGQLFRESSDVTKNLYMIFEKLDGAILGIGKCALSQLYIEREK